MRRTLPRLELFPYSGRRSWHLLPSVRESNVRVVGLVLTILVLSQAPGNAAPNARFCARTCRVATKRCTNRPGGPPRVRRHCARVLRALLACGARGVVTACDAATEVTTTTTTEPPSTTLPCENATYPTCGGYCAPGQRCRADAGTCGCVERTVPPCGPMGASPICTCTGVTGSLIKGFSQPDGAPVYATCEEFIASLLEPLPPDWCTACETIHADTGSSELGACSPENPNPIPCTYQCTDVGTGDPCE